MAGMVVVVIAICVGLLFIMLAGMGIISALAIPFALVVNLIGRLGTPKEGK